MPRSRFLQSTVISIASDEYPVGRGQNTEAKIGQPCGPRITRNYAAMVAWLLTGSPPWLALISGWRLSGATSQGQPGTPAWMLPSMRDGLSAQLMEVWCPFRGSSMGRHVHRALRRNALRDLLTIVPTKACWQRNYVGAYSRFRPKYSKATVRGNIVPTRCFINIFLLLLLRDLQGFTTPRQTL